MEDSRLDNAIFSRSHLPFFIWLGYVSFVVYGSLVPLDYRVHSLGEAWAAFQNIPFLQLGVDSRADWIANGVLYVPVGFLTAFLLLQAALPVPRVLVYSSAGVFSLALALAVEFTQLFFPPRTVSLNDILAESAGVLIGLALAARYAHRFLILLTSFSGARHGLWLRLLEAYVLGYLAFSFFPYDLLLSWSELVSRAESCS